MTTDWDAIVAPLLEFLARYGLSILGGIAIALFGWMAASWAGRAAERGAHRSNKLGPTVAPTLGKVVRVAALLVVLIAVLDAFGVETSALLAAVGAIGLGIGLALKDTIADVAAGVLLLGLRPFDAGDAVEVAGGTLGTVDAIDLFETRLTSFEGVPIVMPNRNVRNATIKNFSRAATRRIDLTVGVAYDADVDRAVAMVRSVVEGDSRVLAEPEPLVNTTALGDSSVDLLVRVWTAPADFFTTQLDLHRKIKLALDEAGIGPPFPQREIRIIQGDAA